jgi:hypothetical protein
LPSVPHAWHSPSHSLSQHTGAPLAVATQFPDAQAMTFPHVCPSRKPHAPRRTHWYESESTQSSFAASSNVQVPTSSGASQRSHTPPHASLQHTPSVQ